MYTQEASPRDTASRDEQIGFAQQATEKIEAMLKQGDTDPQKMKLYTQLLAVNYLIERFGMHESEFAESGLAKKFSDEFVGHTDDLLMQEIKNALHTAYTDKSVENATTAIKNWARVEWMRAHPELDNGEPEILN